LFTALSLYFGASHHPITPGENLYSRGIRPMSTLHQIYRPSPTEMLSMFIYGHRRGVSYETEREGTTPPLCRLRRPTHTATAVNGTPSTSGQVDSAKGPRRSKSRPAEIDFLDFCELLEDHKRADSTDGFNFEYFVRMHDNDMMNDLDSTSLQKAHYISRTIWNETGYRWK